ncbi:MAG: ABC transporter permease subunit, partial [Dehalococcoidia bacterium]
EWPVVIRHALKNAMIPVITLIGILIPFQLGQLVVVERIFNVPGIGSLLLQGIDKRDFPLIQGVAIFLGAIVVFSNLIVDLIYSWLDPRIRYN